MRLIKTIFAGEIASVEKIEMRTDVPIASYIIF
jgi:hypothetical protein